MKCLFHVVIIDYIVEKTMLLVRFYLIRGFPLIVHVAIDTIRLVALAIGNIIG